MSSFRPRRPSAALVVSVVALILALGGTAYAGVILGKNSVGSKQLKNGAVTTKKIKNGAVNGSKLNLAGVKVPNANHANIADSATNANHATTANSATNATNASQLGGLAPATYLGRIAQGSGGSAGTPVGGTATELASATLTVPSGVNFVLLNGVSTFAAGGGTPPDNYSMWFQLDATCSFTNRVGTEFGQLTTGADQNTTASVLAVATTSGAHTYRLCGSVSGGGTSFDADLTAQTVAGGSDGGTTLSRIAVSRSHSLPSTDPNRP